MPKSFEKESRSTQSNSRAQNPATSSMTLGDYLQSQGGSFAGTNPQHGAQSTPAQTAIPFNDLPFGYHSFMGPAMQAQNIMVPLAMFPDGSTLVSYNGMGYRASWNGTNTIMEPFQPLQLPVDQQYYPQAYSQGFLNSSQYNVAPQPSQASVPSMPLVSATNVARPDISKIDSSLQQHAQNGDELSLKNELANLDKHLALYHYQITPVERASLIARRKLLVEGIDRIRLRKEKPKHSIPIVAPTGTALPVTPAAQPTSDPNGLPEVAQNGRNAKGGTINKHLSPAAPAFVPRNTSNLPSSTTGIRTASQQTKHQYLPMRIQSRGVDPAPTTQSNANFSIRPGHFDHQPSVLKPQATSHNEESSTSSVLDPSDPAMRVIDYEDIEYAARYLYNWTKDTKTYCTTVAEFQEAVRRVREQARLYGCAGGQSKDPAYDAEQDLWWAICDRDPIPLPSKIADHVAHPRAWNWNDSAFNYRRQGANDNPGPGIEHARNSPRVVGWDPATTDKMKDVMDVSRSYFALKGQLSSVSFRDFTYDHDGNRRLLQSDTAAPTAYATAPKYTTCRDHSPMVDTQQKQFRPNFESSALKEVSTSDLNVQHKNSAINAHSNRESHGRAPEAVSLHQGVPLTPENKCIQQPFEASNVNSTIQASKPHPYSGHGMRRSKNAETAHFPHHACFEDCPETPIARGIHSASKGAETPQMKVSPFKVCMNPLPDGSGNAYPRAGSVTPAYFWDSTKLPSSSRKPTEEELNGIWYQTPLDEVTQKYLDDMKSYDPFRNVQANEKNHGVHAVKDQRQISESSEPVTESKSSWGPEQGTTPTAPSRSNRSEPLKHAMAEEHEVIKAAKVNIPCATTIRAPIPRRSGNDPFSTSFIAHNTLDSREVDAVNIPR